MCRHQKRLLFPKLCWKKLWAARRDVHSADTWTQRVILWSNYNVKLYSMSLKQTSYHSHMKWQVNTWCHTQPMWMNWLSVSVYQCCCLAHPSYYHNNRCGWMAHQSKVDTTKQGQEPITNPVMLQGQTAPIPHVHSHSNTSEKTCIDTNATRFPGPTMSTQHLPLSNNNKKTHVHPPAQHLHMMLSSFLLRPQSTKE